MTKEEKEVYNYTLETQHHCQLCGMEGDLAMHHIRTHGTRRTYVGNIARLCPRCHQQVHTNMRYYTPLLVDKMNKLYDMDLPVYVKPKKLANTCPYQTIQEDE